jgi:hypothetical protein
MDGAVLVGVLGSVHHEPVAFSPAATLYE